MAQKAKKNQGKTQAKGLYAKAAQKRQNNLNKALGDTGKGRVKRKPFAGAKKQ